MIENDIKKFSEQFSFVPLLENSAKIKSSRQVVVGGMGGSHLSADLLKILDPTIHLTVWSDYGLPSDVEFTDGTLFIASSYSGNTEETMDFFSLAVKNKLLVAVITSGGKLLELARNYQLPYVLVPGSLQPRMALGYSLLALLKILGEDKIICEANAIAPHLKSDIFEEEGARLAEIFRGKIILVYSSKMNFPLAYIFKIKLNENAKVPAFSNFLPELDHNEIVGFDNLLAGDKLNNHFVAIFLRDQEDHPRVLKRFDLTKKLLEARGVSTLDINLSVKSKLEKIFNLVSLSDWASFYLAQNRKIDPESVGVIEELKRKMLE